jgi:hypothetical protein
MNKLTVTWVVLLILSIVSGISSTDGGYYISVLILVMAAIKFVLVSFNFMELFKAHVFWKITIISYLLVFSIIILSII